MHACGINKIPHVAWHRYDIQEPVDVYQKFATSAGFGQAKEIAGDGNFMKVLAFQKEAVAAA